MPVIEQTKGIIMAQHRCGPEEAFEALCRASQLANVKVHVLAADGQRVASGNDGAVTLISLGHQAPASMTGGHGPPGGCCRPW